MSDAFRPYSRPIEEWPAWALDLVEAGKIVCGPKVVVVSGASGPIKCQPGDYIVRAKHGPIVVSALVYEKGMVA